MNKLVAVVIVNWNKKDMVLNLLGSLIDISYKEFSVFVVDNASTDGSVEAIKKYFPDITVLVNQENLGGTGGFNTGISYVCKNKKFNYIWLLDNDAEVTKDALKNLVVACESDQNIAIAGSLIKDINNRSVIVEAGSKILKNQIGVEPYYRNSRRTNLAALIDVDYVAICSALVRVEAIKKVGIMDSRFFLFWDDMDWGWSFKKNDFRVVCATNSVVYHMSFTDRRRGDKTNYYYGIRNPLLTYSKNAFLWERIPSFYSFSRFFFKMASLFLLNNEMVKFNLCKMALKDYLLDKWGGCFYNLNFNADANIVKPNFKDKKIIFFAGYDFEVNNKIGEKLLEECSELYFVVPSDREEIYKNLFKNQIGFDRNKIKSNKYNFELIKKLFSLKCDIFLSTYYIHLNFAAKEYYQLDEDRYLFQFKGSRNKNLLRIIGGFLAGEILGHIFFPILLAKSYIYKITSKKNLENPFV